METALRTIIAAIDAGEEELDDAWLDKLVRERNRASHDASRRVAKRRLLPYYLQVKRDDPARWEGWGVSPACERRLVRLLTSKPRRTASGVATITVLTKPWPCSSDCLYCPNDVRMPKSYLADEPACQRAERCCFDPYLQVAARVRVLEDMGHPTDKAELIVLGGTWSDYPRAYQTWFVSELFRALNEAGTPAGVESERRRREAYAACGVSGDADEARTRALDAQRHVNARERSYNQAVRELFQEDEGWRSIARGQVADLEELDAQHARNEDAAHRVVGLVIETRPDLVDAPSLALMRRLGCTKVQMGIQSLSEDVLRLNDRRVSVMRIARAFALLRLFGFKLHVHFMVNLPGADPEADKADYRRLVTDPAFLPDEVKLYPCCLVRSARLAERFDDGSWTPYDEPRLLDVLKADTAATPEYTRISRMIRDISSHDIVAGNKKTNLRQLVEAGLREDGAVVREMRQREIATDEVDVGSLRLACTAYETSATEERFLQWVTDEGRIAGFLRLSLPRERAARAALPAEDLEGLPVSFDTAMIREVHVYGRAARLHAPGDADAAQHAGLGRRLVEEACRQTRSEGYADICVISAVGTRNYYRSLGFRDAGLYQRRALRSRGAHDGSDG